VKVKELARAAGVTPETVRHYARAGLLEPACDPGNGYRLFAAEDLARLRFVRAARRLCGDAMSREEGLSWESTPGDRGLDLELVDTHRAAH